MVADFGMAKNRSQVAVPLSIVGRHAATVRHGRRARVSHAGSPQSTLGATQNGNDRSEVRYFR